MFGPPAREKRKLADASAGVPARRVTRSCDCELRTFFQGIELSFAHLQVLAR